MVYIEFVFLTMSASGKTKIYEIQTVDSRHILGYIKWFGAWRKYCFYPEQHTVFEQDCLKVISTFLIEKTKEQYKKKKAA